jgi:hypothetical protein
MVGMQELLHSSSEQMHLAPICNEMGWSFFANRITSDRIFWYKQTIDKLPFAQRAIGDRIKIFFKNFDYRLQFEI